MKKDYGRIMRMELDNARGTRSNIELLFLWLVRPLEPHHRLEIAVLVTVEISGRDHLLHQLRIGLINLQFLLGLAQFMAHR